MRTITASASTISLRITSWSRSANTSWCPAACISSGPTAWIDSVIKILAMFFLLCCGDAPQNDLSGVYCTLCPPKFPIENLSLTYKQMLITAAHVFLQMLQTRHRNCGIIKQDRPKQALTGPSFRPVPPFASEVAASYLSGLRRLTHGHQPQSGIFSHHCAGEEHLPGR